MVRLALLRHGQSLWNRDDRFTGWTDVGLTDEGEAEARRAAALLSASGFEFDVCYTSVLKRAIKTLWIVLEEMDRMWLPVHLSWRLNERHYGALQGQSKTETARKVGKEQVFIWRRSYDIQPPALENGDPRCPDRERRYAGLDRRHLPRTESLKDTVERVLPYWRETIAPEVRAGRCVLISAHGNSLRALVKYLDAIPDDEIPKLEIPTGAPLIYELDDGLRALRHYYLGPA